jgi:hypothetical protein
MSKTKKKGGGTAAPASNTPLTCLEQWKEDLRKLDNGLLLKQAVVASLSTTKANAGTWEAKLKYCWDRAQRTNRLINEITAGIESLSGQVERVCANAACADEALGNVFCLIKKFYDCTDAFRGLINSTRDTIISNCDEGETSIILACLNEMTDKLGTTIAGQKEILKMVIDLLKQAKILSAAICESKNTVGEENCGLNSLVGLFEELFNNEEGTDSPNMPASDSELPPTGSCGATLERKISMPLENDEYYTGLKDQYEAAQTEYLEVSSSLDEARLSMEGMQSCATSLRNAIAASEKAKDCK